jgi:hypothetical protein
MAGLGGGVHVQARTALSALMAVLTPASRSPAMAEQGQGHHYAVTLTEIERFDGGVKTITPSCPVTGACIGLVRVEVRGRPYDYLLSAVASDDRISFIFRGRTPRTPALNHRQGYPFSIPFAPDGIGQRDMALAALRGAELQSGRTRGGWGLPNPPLTPVANVHVTVRCEDAAGQSR